MSLLPTPQDYRGQVESGLRLLYPHPGLLSPRPQRRGRASHGLADRCILRLRIGVAQDLVSNAAGLQSDLELLREAHLPE